MTINETRTFDGPLTEMLSAEATLLDQVRVVVAQVLTIEGEDEISRYENYAIAFRGSLLIGPGDAFTQLTAALEPLGFTPFLQRERGVDVVLAVQGLLGTPEEDAGGGLLRRLARASGRSPVWLHAALLLATIATTMYAGAFLLQTDGTASLGQILAAGGPFALTLLLILGVHEMGHYVAARYHRVKVTLPYFIPLPIPGSLGTLGATIFIRSPLQTRRVLFDVGISGPLAGLAVALPLFVIGLLLAPIEFGAPITMSFRGVGTPPLLDWIGGLVVTEGSLSRAILLHPVALAAWFGVLLTALNLLPLGQFDGGHVAYALVGRLAWGLAGVTFFALALGGLLLWPTWLIWAFLASLTGLRHPPPHDDITPLDLRRKVVGWLTVLVFALIIMPQPIIARQGLLPSSNSNAVPLPTIAPLEIPTAQPFALPESPQ